MGAHVKEKCMYIRLCIRLIHSVFGSIVRDSQEERRAPAQCLKRMRKALRVHASSIKRFCLTQEYGCRIAVQGATEDASFDCPVALALISATALAWRLAHRPVRINNSLSPSAQAALPPQPHSSNLPFNSKRHSPPHCMRLTSQLPSHRIVSSSKPRSASITKHKQSSQTTPPPFRNLPTIQWYCETLLPRVPAHRYLDN